MPTLNELLNRNREKLQAEVERYKQQKQTEITRHNDTRVWKSHINDLNIDENTVPADKEPAKHRQIKTEKTTSFAMGILARWKLGMLMLAILMAPAMIAVSMLPKNYFSTLYLYAPEKADSISSRMTLFYNRVEFASFPTEVKMPISLLSRRLRQDEARNWVIKTYLERFQNTIPYSFKPESVRADVGYVAATEILVIEGFANHPDIAVKITELYSEYFQNLRRDLDGEHRSKIEEWFQKTNDILEKQSNELYSQLQFVTKTPETRSSFNNINGKMSENASQIDLKLSSLIIEREELLRAFKATDFEEMTYVSDTDVQNLLKIHQELNSRQDNQQYYYKIDEIEAQIRTLLQNKIQEKSLAIKNLEQDQRLVNKKLSQTNELNSIISINQQKESTLISQLNAIRTQQTELQKLKSQLDIELSSGALNSKIIQSPVSNENSIRPLPTLQYLFAAAIVFMLALFILSILELTSRIDHNKSI